MFTTLLILALCMVSFAGGILVGSKHKKRVDETAEASKQLYNAVKK